MTNPNRDEQIKLQLDMFTRNVVKGIRYLTGRMISAAELGVIREQAAVALRNMFLRGQIARHNKVQALVSPWDTDNEPTDPYVPRKQNK